MLLQYSYILTQGVVVLSARLINFGFVENKKANYIAILYYVTMATGMWYIPYHIVIYRTELVQTGFGFVFYKPKIN